ncbi:ORF35 [Ictalurid herpesvirus 1]|uniref:Uncharacterized protein ORF35 n=1 Tax=Ictalurid herpesvirus 1 (strain Auburn) TaxID=766178 RepID=VG35_ICHVA|nr:ORF35 [Ictalurid herpesvirus 1]Q00109.1 RecName: Full=Uncharacterized protein ORF35 [Ictalurid herpesvirus 1 (strain Auburn)]AAA88138.1 ORF35 [Ictalurid herpesvirus 1]
MTAPMSIEPETGSSPGLTELISKWGRLSDSFLERRLTNISSARQEITAIKTENEARAKALRQSLEEDRAFWTNKITALGYKVAKRRMAMVTTEPGESTAPHLEVVHSDKGLLGLFEISAGDQLLCPSAITPFIRDRGGPGTCPLCLRTFDQKLEGHIYTELISSGHGVSRGSDGAWRAHFTGDTPPVLFPRKTLGKERAATLSAAIKQFKCLQVDHCTLEGIIESLAIKAHKILDLCE